MDSSKLKVFWKQILVNVQESISEAACQTWLEPILPVSLHKSVLTLKIASEFQRQWIEERYQPKIEETIYELTGEHVSIVLKVGRNSKKKRSNLEGSLQTTLSITSSDSDNMTAPTATDVDYFMNSSLIPKYTFDNFIIGKSNEFAHAAALAVAKSPGRSYNPFFIYGGVGLGKTHLMHAIGNAIVHNFPSKKVLYVSTEEFTNELINSLRENKIAEFKNKYRSIDVLLVDDIQFLAGKDSTQEEFFHTFNSLYNLEKQIVLSSDHQPREVEGLEERLRSRFNWGLVTDIQKPDLETRIAILQKKAMIEKIDVPYEVIIKIAKEINTNVRDLEGVFTRAVAFASLTKKDFNMKLFNESQASMDFKEPRTPVSIKEIENAVADYFKLSVDELHRKSREPRFVHPRQIAIYLCRKLTYYSFPAIARHFGGINHSTAIRAYEKIKSKCNKNFSFNEIIKNLIVHLKKQ